MARRSDNRGFGSMDPERRRRIASEGSRSSRGGRDRSYEDEYDEGYDDEYDEDEEQGVSNRYGDEDYDQGYEDEDEYEDTGYENEDEYEEDEDWEGEADDRRGRSSSRGRNSSSRGRRSSPGRSGVSSRRGFAGMDPEEQRRIARRGGERTSRTHGRDFYEDIGRQGGESVSNEYGPEFYSRIGRQGGRARWEEDEDYDRGRSHRRRSGSRENLSGRSGSSYGRSRSSSGTGTSLGGRRGSSSGRSNSGRRGFGAMPREEVRRPDSYRVASKGGRARWGEDEDRSRNRRTNAGRSR